MDSYGGEGGGSKIKAMKYFNTTEGETKRDIIIN
jgi:hypothetical protein